MKKLPLILFVILLAIPITLIGGKEEEKVEAPVEEAIVTEEDMDEIDPLIVELRQGLDKYKFGPPDYEGPGGLKPVWHDEFFLTKGEVKKIREGNYTIALARHGSQGEYSTAFFGGIIDFCEYLNIEVIADTSAEFDDATLANNIETMLVLNPDVMTAWPMNQVTAPEIFKPVVDAGVKLVLNDNGIDAFTPGKEYVGVCGANTKDLGAAMGHAAGKSGAKKIAYLYFDAEAWVVNFLDQVAKETLRTEYPDVEIIAEQGWVDEISGPGEAAAAIISRYPEVEAIIVTFNAHSAAATCEEMNRPDIKIISAGMDVPYLLNMLSGGNMYMVCTDFTYTFGTNMAIMAGYAVLGKKSPEYVVSPAASVFKHNVEEMWKLNLPNVPVPQEIKDLL
jgi:ribose transport system substrate-binding protein